VSPEVGAGHRGDALVPFTHLLPEAHPRLVDEQALLQSIELVLQAAPLHRPPLSLGVEPAVATATAEHDERAREEPEPVHRHPPRLPAAPKR
jgi:hypothetical protein